MNQACALPQTSTRRALLSTACAWLAGCSNSDARPGREGALGPFAPLRPFFQALSALEDGRARRTACTVAHSTNVLLMSSVPLPLNSEARANSASSGKVCVERP